jgi:hypothetical protein
MSNHYNVVCNDDPFRLDIQGAEKGKGGQE